MEKLDFPMKNLQASEEGGIFAKKVWGNRQGEGRLLFLPAYRHTVKQEQYSF